MRERIIDLDAVDANGIKKAGVNDTIRGVMVKDVIKEWEEVKSILGNPPLGSPAIINDPESPVHFGINLNWQVVLNLASVPPGLSGSEMLAWLKIFPIYHEMGHYIICPYDGITHARLAMKVLESWKTAMTDEIMFLINFFADIVVNDELYSIAGSEYFNAMKKWVEHTVVETFKAGYSISNLYLVFVLVHEMMWKKRFVVFTYPDLVKRVAAKVHSIINVKGNWYTMMASITSILKPMMMQKNDAERGYGIDVLVDEMKGVVENNGKPGEDGEKRDQKRERDDGKKEGKSNISLKKGGRTSKKPFDMTFFMSDPTADKTRGELDELEKENEKERYFSIVNKLHVPFEEAREMMRMMNFSRDEDDAWRYWIRARAKGMLSYDPVVLKKNKGGSTVPSEWEWTDPFNDWNAFSSIMAFPAFPYPPFAVGNKERSGIDGRKSLPDVRDLLILRDSSGSMSMIINDAGKEWDESVKSVNRQNTKFNLSSLATFAALHAASERGADISVINFSGSCVDMPWLKSTKRGIDMAEKLILTFIGGSTVLPLQKMAQKLVEREKCFVLIITDSYLHNWNEFFKNVDGFTERGHCFSMIFISDSRTEINVDLMKKLDQKSVAVQMARSPSELFGITLKEINRIYN